MNSYSTSSSSIYFNVNKVIESNKRLSKKTPYFFNSAKNIIANKSIQTKKEIKVTHLTKSNKLNIK